MGEAKRRRDYLAAHAEEIAADLAFRQRRFQRIEAIAGGLDDPYPEDGPVGTHEHEVKKG